MRILFCGNTFPDALKYLREHLDSGANDEIIIWASHRTRPGTQLSAMRPGYSKVEPDREKYHSLECGDLCRLRALGPTLCEEELQWNPFVSMFRMKCSTICAHGYDMQDGQIRCPA